VMYVSLKEEKRGLVIDHVVMWIGREGENAPVDEEDRLYLAEARGMWDIPENRGAYWHVGINLEAKCEEKLPFLIEIFLVNPKNNATGFMAVLRNNYTFCCKLQEEAPPVPWTQSTKINLNPENCTRNHLYWKDHNAYSMVLSERMDWGFLESETILCSKSWLEILQERPTTNNLWLILAQQWVTAKLNIQNGVSAEPIAQTLSKAGEFLEQCGENLLNNNVSDQNLVKNLSNILSQYNNGYLESIQCPSWTRTVPECSCMELVAGENVVAVYFRGKEESICLTYPSSSLPTLVTLSIPVPNVHSLIILSEAGIVYSDLSASVNFTLSRGTPARLVANGTDHAWFWLSVTSSVSNIENVRGGMTSRTILGIVFGTIAALTSVVACFVGWLNYKKWRRQQEEISWM